MKKQMISLSDKKRLQSAAKEGKVAAAQMAVTNPLLKELVKRFDLRLDLEKIATYGTKIS